MKLSHKGLLFILHHEAVVLNRYRDSKGIWTISVGVTRAAGAGVNPETFTEMLTIEQALDMFRHVLPRYEEEVQDAFGEERMKTLKQHEYDAAVSFHWNTGAIGHSTWVHMLRDNRPMDEIVRHMMMWNKPAEIIPRRQKEAHLLATGDYGPLDVHIYTADATGRIHWHDGKRLKGETALAMLDTGSAIA